MLYMKTFSSDSLFNTASKIEKRKKVPRTEVVTRACPTIYHFSIFNTPIKPIMVNVMEIILTIKYKGT